MGNGCSKNIRKLNKNTVASNYIATTSSSSNTDNHPIDPTKIHHPKNVTKSSNSIESTPSTSINVHDRNSTPKLNGSNHIGTTETIKNPKISSQFDSVAFELASCIDTNSIIFDRDDRKPVKPSFARSVSVDSSNNKTVHSVEVNKFTAHLNRLFKSNQNLMSTHSTIKSENTFPKLYHRFSGSVQSLFNGNLNNNRKRNLSASDTNLNRINRCCALSQQQLIDNDYCPSVLYNRKARKSYSEKNLDKTQTFSRWKNQLWLKFSRKKTNPSARKS